MQNKLVVSLILSVFFLNHLVCQRTYYPKTIKVMGVAEKYLSPDEITISYTIVNESEEKKMKLTLDKVEGQIRTQFNKRNISLSKIETKEQGNICNMSTKDYIINKLSLVEYQSIFRYLANHYFITNLKIKKATISKSNFPKDIDTLISKSYADALRRAGLIAKVSKEKIGIQSIDIGENRFSFEKDYDCPGLDLDSNLSKVNFSVTAQFEFMLEDLTAPENAYFLPRTFHLVGSSTKALNVENVKISFVHSLAEYEDAEPDIVYKKSKAKLEEWLKKQIKTTFYILAKESYDPQMNSDKYEIEIGGDINKMKSVIQDLKNNKNISDLKLVARIFDEDYKKYDEELITSTLKNTNDIVSRYAKIYNIEVEKAFDYTDHEIENNQYGWSNYYNTVEKEDLELLLTKKMNISYKLK
jgi:hypothetical protein